MGRLPGSTNLKGSAEDTTRVRCCSCGTRKYRCYMYQVPKVTGFEGDTYKCPSCIAQQWTAEKGYRIVLMSGKKAIDISDL